GHRSRGAAGNVNGQNQRPHRTHPGQDQGRRSGRPAIHPLNASYIGWPLARCLWRRQASSNVWIETWCDLVIKWKPAFWAEEKTQITSGVEPYIKARAIERRAYTCREQFPTRGRAHKASGHEWSLASSMCPRLPNGCLP